MADRYNVDPEWMEGVPGTTGETKSVYDEDVYGGYTRGAEALKAGFTDYGDYIRQKYNIKTPQIEYENVPGRGQADYRFLYDPGWKETVKGGWYSPGGYNYPGDPSMGIKPGYTPTGMPQTIEEAMLVRDYFAKTGTLPTAEQANAMLSDKYGASSTTRDLTYMPGSTPFELGTKTEKEEYDWYTGEVIGATGARRPGAGQLQRRGKAMETGKYKAPPIKSIQEFEKEYQVPAFRAKLGDYLTAQEQKLQTEIAEHKRSISDINSYVKAGSLDKKKADKMVATATMEITKKEQALANLPGAMGIIENAIAQGRPIETMPFYQTLKNYESPTLQAMYQQMYLNKYPQEVAQGQQAFAEQERMQRPAPYGLAVPPPRPQVDPMQEAERQYKPVYQSWVGTLSTTVSGKTWLQQNYSALINEWFNYGTGQQFMDWVKLRLKGSIPEITSDQRRFAPPTRYVR